MKKNEDSINKYLSQLLLINNNISTPNETESKEIL